MRYAAAGAGEEGTVGIGAGRDGPLIVVVVVVVIGVGGRLSFLVE